jgi:hypothetical protein
MGGFLSFASTCSSDKVAPITVIRRSNRPCPPDTVVYDRASGLALWLKRGHTMTVFRRNFCVKRLSDAVLNENGWLCDLLRYWRPAGDAIGKELRAFEEEEPPHLRLAIRKGSLNFYRAGQSVAKVSFDRRKKPQATIHNKYVYEDGSGQAYVRLTPTGSRTSPGAND